MNNKNGLNITKAEAKAALNHVLYYPCIRSVAAQSLYGKILEQWPEFYKIVERYEKAEVKRLEFRKQVLGY